MLHLRLVLTPDGLGGGNLESQPAISYEGSWSGARFSRRTPIFTTMASDGPAMAYDIAMPLEAIESASDPTLWLSMVAQTTQSGIPDIDKRESGYAKRDQEAGAGCVALSELLRDGQASLALVEPMIYRESLRAISQHQKTPNLAQAEDRSLALARKGVINVMALDVPAGLTLRRGIFGTPAYLEEMSSVINMLEGQYLRFCTTLDIPAGSGLSLPTRRFAHSPDDPLMEHLHASRLETRVGPLPALAYMMQDGLMRSKEVQAEVRALRSMLNPQHLQELRAQLDSALLARGMTASEFVRIVNQQHARTDDVLFGGYLVALSAVILMATSAVTCVQYKTDGRLPNPIASASLSAEERASLLPPLPPTKTLLQTPMIKAILASARKLSRLQRACQNKHLCHPSFAANAPDLGPSSQTPASSPGRSPWIQGDDWGNGVLAGTTNADDCETVAMAAVLMLETHFQVLRDTLDAHLSDELAALRDVLDRQVPVFAAGTVSEPYVETSAGSDKEADKDKPKHPPLPVKGSPAAAKWSSAGHGYGQLVPRGLLDQMQWRGLNDYQGLHEEDRASVMATLYERIQNYAPWEKKVPIGMIEGTGLVWPYTVNAQEVWSLTAEGSDLATRKSAARISMARGIKVSSG